MWETIVNLSKSKLLALRQCPKRLWLEIHKPHLREHSGPIEARLKVGHRVGDVARRLYDPKGRGIVIDAQNEGFSKALERSQAVLVSAQPVFEAAFAAEGALAFVDVMLPIRRRKELEWRMVEVKSSTSVKDYHRDDVAIQSLVSRAAGVPLASMSLAYIDNEWKHPGTDTFDGLLVEEDLTQEAASREAEVRSWIKEGHAVASSTSEPIRKTGDHCAQPFECSFSAYCRGQEPQARHPIATLPRMNKATKSFVAENELLELADVPDHLLSEIQVRVKKHTISGKTFFDAKGALAVLSKHRLPAVFLDFETIHFAVPIWKGTRPYQQIPFQFSAHRLSRTGELKHVAFLDLTGEDPSKRFASALVEGCGTTEPIFVYNVGFEKARIAELAKRFAALRKTLLAINERLVDLLPVAQQHYYHPSQEGSWSIKAVLPAVVPSLGYESLEGVQDGGMAMEAYLEAIHPATVAARKCAIEQELLSYCKLDTYAMVRIWQVFAGRKDLPLKIKGAVNSKAPC
ncbi:Predicted nuclease, RecB family [Rhodospirillales bacterium URHD0017]|nr:Predicted nuclease, RecB family [Rhodospirillales bacterium URHD0017]